MNDNRYPIGYIPLTMHQIGSNSKETRNNSAETGFLERENNQQNDFQERERRNGSRRRLRRRSETTSRSHRGESRPAHGFRERGRKAHSGRI